MLPCKGVSAARRVPRYAVGVTVENKNQREGTIIVNNLYPMDLFYIALKVFVKLMLRMVHGERDPWRRPH